MIVNKSESFLFYADQQHIRFKLAEILAVDKKKHSVKIGNIGLEGDLVIYDIKPFIPAYDLPK